MTTNLEIIPFRMEIKEYTSDGTFVVEYIPDDPDCYPITHGISIPLDSFPPPTESDIRTLLAGSSPQHYWNQLKLAKTYDHSIREGLVGAVIVNADQILQEQLNENQLNPNQSQEGMTEQELRVLSVTVIVQQVLADLVGSTV